MIVPLIAIFTTMLGLGHLMLISAIGTSLFYYLSRTYE